MSFDYRMFKFLTETFLFPVLLVKIGTSNAVKCPIIEVTNAAESDCNGVYQVSNISVKSAAAGKPAFYRIWPKSQPGVRDDR